MTNRIENISERGARWRRRSGIVWLVIGAAAFAALWSAGAPRWYRVGLALPIALAAAGFLQARERTCVALCAADRREPTIDRPETTLTAAERYVLRRRSVSIVLRILLIAAASTALIVAV